MGVKSKNWVKIGFLFYLFVLLARMPVLADGPEGSITLQLPAQAAGAEVALYSVADFQDGNYVYRPEFAGSNLTIEDLGDAAQSRQAAEQLVLYIESRKIQGEVKTLGADGAVAIKGLSPALYLVAQIGGKDLLSFQPVLVPIPYTSDRTDGWIYDAVISPKYSFPGGAVIVQKVDDEGNAVGKAEFLLQQKTYVRDAGEIPKNMESGSDDGGTYYWKEFKANLVSSGHGQVVITDMPMGSYRLIETYAPDGYVLIDTPHLFSIEKAGEVKENGGVYTASSGKVEELTVVNPQTLPHTGNSSGGSSSGGGSLPKTGDSTPFGWYLALLAVSAAGIAALLFRKKKTK